jgi:hypothetical protein
MPPYSDNLYSADEPEDDDHSNAIDTDADAGAAGAGAEAEADAQSFSQELSPSDGYFNRREDIPSNVYIPDPSLDRKDLDTEDKVLIPGQTPGGARHRATRSGVASTSGEVSEPQSSNNFSPVSPQAHPSIPYASPPSTSADTPSSPPSTARSPTSYIRSPSAPLSSHQDYHTLSERTPLMVGPPPPAYSPSPASPQFPQSPRQYNTFPHPEHDPEPENMGRPSQEYDEIDPLSERPDPVKRRRSPRELVRKLLFGVLLFVIFMSVLTTVMNFAASI